MFPEAVSQARVRPWRAVRAGVAASMALCVAILGHLAGGGAAPAAAAVAVAAPAAGLLAYRIAGQRWTVRTLTALVLALQGGVHLACALTASGPSEPETAPGWAMLAGHAVATLATVMLLRRGEAAIVGLSDRVVARPLRRLAYAMAATLGAARSAYPTMPPVPGSLVRFRLLLLSVALRRRGPPVCA